MGLSLSPNRGPCSPVYGSTKLCTVDSWQVYAVASYSDSRKQRIHRIHRIVCPGGVHRIHNTSQVGSGEFPCRYLKFYIKHGEPHNSYSSYLSTMHYEYTYTSLLTRISKEQQPEPEKLCEYYYNIKHPSDPPTDPAKPARSSDVRTQAQPPSTRPADQQS